jgi:hypothetical protein
VDEVDAVVPAGLDLHAFITQLEVGLALWDDSAVEVVGV